MYKRNNVYEIYTTQSSEDSALLYSTASGAAARCLQWLADKKPKTSTLKKNKNAQN